MSSTCNTYKYIKHVLAKIFFPSLSLSHDLMVSVLSCHRKTRVISLLFSLHSSVSINLGFCIKLNWSSESF